jgi:hypothetical protein
MSRYDFGAATNLLIQMTQIGEARHSAHRFCRTAGARRIANLQNARQQKCGTPSGVSTSLYE